MKFKPTILKTIISLLGGIIVGFCVSIIGCYGCSNSTFYKITFGIGIVVLLIFYILWSLIQKRNL